MKHACFATNRVSIQAFHGRSALLPSSTFRPGLTTEAAVFQTPLNIVSPETEHFARLI